MNGILLILVICTLYYVVYKYFPDKLSETTHKYFAGFVIVYATLYYFLVFETNFTHKVFHNIYESGQQPIYTSKDTYANGNANASLHHQQNPNADIKEQLLMRQSSRCAQCQNHLIINDTMLSYQVPLQAGGPNDPSNLVALCPSCHMFK